MLRHLYTNALLKQTSVCLIIAFLIKSGSPLLPKLSDV